MTAKTYLSKLSASTVTARQEHWYLKPAQRSHTRLCALVSEKSSWCIFSCHLQKRDTPLQLGSNWSILSACMQACQTLLLPFACGFVLCI